jgi:hypothetical protein
LLEKNRAAEGLDNIAGTPVCRPADGAAGRQVHGQRGRAGIAADWNTSFITVLGNVENDLAELNACSEAEMESLGGSFEILAAEAKTLLQHAHEIVACVQNERVDSVLADMQATCESSRSFLEERLEAATTILSTLEQLEQMLRQLTLATHSQEAIARHLLALSVLTNIEVAHLGAAGHNFQLLAQELSTFSKDLFAQTLSLATDTDNHKQAIARVRRELSANLPVLRGEVEHMEHDVAQTLSIVESVLRQQSAMPVEFADSTEAIWRQIVSIISAIQAHDITRQQVDHVQQALGSIAARMDVANSSGLPEVSAIFAALRVQDRQLTNIRETVSIWREQASRCMLAIEQLSAARIVEISASLLNGEQTLSLQLGRIAALQQRSHECCGRMQGTLGGLSSLMELVNGHLTRAQAIRDHLHILMMNALIEAESLDSRGAVVSAIASLIKEVSADWSKMADQSRLRLAELSDLVQQMTTLFEVFSDASRDQLRLGNERTSAGLNSVRDIASRVAEEAFKMKVVTERMSARSVALGQTKSRLDTHFGRIDSALQAIGNLQRDLEKADPRAAGPCDSAAVERWLAETYTTEVERQVLSATLYGGALPSLQASFAGNEVELF